MKIIKTILFFSIAFLVNFSHSSTLEYTFEKLTLTQKKELFCYMDNRLSFFTILKRHCICKDCEAHLDLHFTNCYEIKINCRDIVPLINSIEKLSEKFNQLEFFKFYTFILNKMLGN